MSREYFQIVYLEYNVVSLFFLSFLFSSFLSHGNYVSTSCEHPELFFLQCCNIRTFVLLFKTVCSDLTAEWQDTGQYHSVTVQVTNVLFIR
jgi:hypothetical protein